MNGPSTQLLFGLSLDKEVGTATQLLATGLNLIVDPTWRTDQPGAAFTCLASGVERLLKLTYGLDLQTSGAAFPTTEKLQRLGHNLVALDVKVRPGLEAAADRAGKDTAARALQAASADPYWPGVLAALDAWAAASGRYRDLDVLAGGTPPDDSPQSMWQEVENRYLDDHSLFSSLDDPAHHAAVCERMATSVLTWWFAIYRAWQHGLVGPKAQVQATVLAPKDAHDLAEPLKDLTRGW